MSPNAPVLLVKGCTYDHEGEPLYRSVQVFSGERFKLAISQDVYWENWLHGGCRHLTHLL